MRQERRVRLIFAIGFIWFVILVGVCRFGVELALDLAAYCPAG
jgi:hypothetical protein